MTKKAKLELTDLRVTSFPTSTKEIKGGYELTDYSCVGVCHLSTDNGMCPASDPTFCDCNQTAGGALCTVECQSGFFTQCC